jgi:hypothetical protein
MVHHKKKERWFKDISESEVNRNLRKEYAILNSGRYVIAGRAYNKVLDRISLLREIKRRMK